MTRLRKTGLGFLVLLLALTLGFGLASCGSKDTTPAYGYGEEGTYYYSASDDTDYLLTLRQGTYILTFGTEGQSGTYEYSEGALTLYSGDEEEPSTGTMTDSGISLRYDGKTYLFLRYEYYTVTFTDGSSTITTQSVLNGKAATDPGDASKDGYVFLGWYADSAFTTRYEFNTSITGNTTIYARFIEVEGTTEYKVTYDFGNGETYTTETLNGRIYDLPEAESSGQTFIGWWVSATNQADELTYKYEGETLYEDTTLFAVFASGSYIGASIKEGTLYWENSPASQMTVTVTDEGGATYSYDTQTTSQSFSIAALSATGTYSVTVSCGGVTETLTYVSNGLFRVSGFTVISGSILMYGAVANAERYYVSIDCGTEGHDHEMIDNGTSLYYDFSSCEMPAEGITFTVYAEANGYVTSVSSPFNYFLGLDRVTVTVENGEVTWERVALAQGYEVYIDGTLVATTSDTSWSLSGYGTGTYEVSVRPVTTGYYSELSEAVTFTKTTLASPEISGIDDYTITWTPVEGATGYTVSINGTETTVGGGDITSLILSGDNYTEGLDSYEISVKALAPDSANDSPYGETITVTGNSVGSAVSYNNGTVTWQYSLSASEYRITVNDGDEISVTGTNSTAITLTKSGNNEITIYFVNDYGEIYGTAEITVYAYAIVFDARGGTAYDADGNEIDVMYVAKGDTVTLPGVKYTSGDADFVGWYTLPDLWDDPDADSYAGDGVAFEDGTTFNGNSTIVLYAFWINQRLTITLDPGIGYLTDEDGNAIDSTLIPINGSRYTIAVPECDDKAYVFYGWYSGPSGTGNRYTLEDGSACLTFTKSSITTLYAYWAEAFVFALVDYGDDTVLSVSKGANIERLTEVTIPESYTIDGVEYPVKYIGNSAFSGCNSLEVINIPDTVIYIELVNGGYAAGSGAFSQSPDITDINVYVTGEPSTTKEVVYYSEDGVLFWYNEIENRTELLCYPHGRTETGYTIPETVRNENEYEFSGLSEVPVVRDVTATASGAFSYNESLVRMEIPEHITFMADHAFYGCKNLVSVKFSSAMTEVGASTFYECSSLTDVTIPEGIETIGDHAFYRCDALVSIKLPSTLTFIGNDAFFCCYALEDINIPYGVTSIEDYTFDNCYSLKTVEIPASVESIGISAFEDCWGLVEMTIPASVKTIELYAFYRCYSLKSLIINDGLEYIGNRSFFECTSLTVVHLPDTVTEIDVYAFYNCTALYDLRLGSGLETIGDRAFYGCSSLETVTIPEGMKNLGDYAFYGCSSLKTIYFDAVSMNDLSSGNHTFSDVGNSVDGIDVYIGEKVERIPGYLFYPVTGAVIGDSGTTPLRNVYYADNGALREIGTYAFAGSALTEFYLPDTVETIGSYAFYRSVFTEVVIPDSVVTIGTYAFNYNNSLITLVIGDGVTDIGNYAFYQCQKLTSVTIGRSVESVGTNAFGYCYKLVEVCNLSSLVIEAGSSTYGSIGLYAKNVYTEGSGSSRLSSEDDFMFIYDDDGAYFLVGYYGDDLDITLPTSVDGKGYDILQYAFYDSDITGITITGGVGNIENHAFSNAGSLASADISGVTEIGANAFAYCYDLVSVNLSGGLKTIGNYAFYYCTSLVSAVLPDSVEEVGTYIFSYCTALTSVNIPSSLTYIGTRMFDHCSALASMVIPDTVETINEYAFYCAGLTSVTIGSGVTYIADRAFDHCGSVTSLVIPDNVKEAGAYAFGEMSSLVTVTIGRGLEVLPTDAFYYDSALTDVIFVSDNVKTIGDYCFAYCTSLKSAPLPDCIETIGAYAFRNCTGLETVTIPGKVTSLPDGGTSGNGYGVFGNCTSLKEVIFDDALTTIGSYAFYQCSALETVTFGSGLEVIGDHAFHYCTSLKSMSIPEGVTSIGTYTFVFDTALESVYIPSTVYTTGADAFYGCTALTSVTISYGVTEIGSESFNGCSALETIDMPDSVTSIGALAFYQCYGLLYVLIPDSVTTIGASAFAYDNSLVFVQMGKGVSSIGSNAFRYNEKLIEYYNRSSLDVSVNAGSSVGYAGQYALHVYTESGDNWLRDYDGFMFFIGGGYSYLLGYVGDETDLVFPDSGEIGEYSVYKYAFNSQKLNNTKIASAVIPDTVTGIGSYAFQNCVALTSVTIGKGVGTIDTYAFDGCTALAYLTLSNGLGTIGNYAFRNCSSLLSVAVPGTVTSIGTYCFQNCTSMRTLTFGEGTAASIGNYAFNGCSSLMSVEIPDSITSLGTYVFQNCTSLASIVIGEGVTSLGNYCFDGCSALRSVTLPSTLTSMGTYLFRNCTSLVSVTIPDGVTSIGNYDFYGCTSLKEACLPDGLTSIGNQAFYGCRSLITVTVPYGVTSIGTSAFQNCYRLVEVFNRSTLTVEPGSSGNGYVGYYAKSVYTEEGDSRLTYDGEFVFVYDDDGNWFLADYTGTASALVLPESADGHAYEIINYVFYGNETLTSVVIPEGVIGIGEYCFYGCASLQRVDGGASVESIGGYAFYNCAEMASIELGEALISIGDYCFYGCSSLTSITIPDGVTSLGQYAFCNCTSLKAAYVGDGVGSLGQRTFDGCASLEEIYLGVSIASIGNYCFNGCTSLKAVEIPGSVESLGTYVFQNCESLESVVIGDGVESVGNYCFYNCYELKSIAVPDSVTSLGTYCFYNCYALKSATLGSGITSVGNYTFYNCSSLGSITLPDGVTTIGQYAFYGCASLKSIVLPADLTTVNAVAFYGCASLETVYYGGSEADWAYVSVNSSNNSCLTDAELYYYSETQPVVGGNFWHYDEGGEIALW